MTSNKSSNYFSIQIEWKRIRDARFPYAAIVNDCQWIIRINDFPKEPLYTLIIDDQELEDFSDWPDRWHKPESKEIS